MKFKILLFITAFFILLGWVLPYVNSEFDTNLTENNPTYLSDDVESEDFEGWGIISAPQVIGSIFSMFFWTFGALPAWIDMIFIIFRVIFYFILIDLLWIG